MNKLSPPIQIVFQDIDGCLNPADGRWFPSGDHGILDDEHYKTIESIRSAIAESSVEHVILNTGRDYDDTCFIAEAFASPKMRYWLLEHSAYAYDALRKTRVDLKRIAETLQNTDAVAKYSSLEDIKQVMAWYRNEGQTLLEKKLGVQGLAALDKEANLSLEIPEGVTPENIIEHLHTLIEEVFEAKQIEHIQYCFSSHFVDVSGKIHKSDGAHLMCEYLGVQADATLAMGDGMNDEELFQTWPHLYCPKNAHETIRHLCQTRGGQVSEQSFGNAAVSLYKSI